MRYEWQDSEKYLLAVMLIVVVLGFAQLDQTSDSFPPAYFDSRLFNFEEFSNPEYAPLKEP